MANPDFSTIGANPTFYLGTENLLQLNLLEADGATPLDVSAFNAVHLNLSAPVGNGSLLPLGDIALLPAYASPTSTWTISSANMGTLSNGGYTGSFQFAVYGKNLVGDDFIQLAAGTAFVVNGFDT
jgi:hypothetical protein